jgi:TRAP-type C4-dicarboxylate transport system permease small subunit
MKSVSAMTQEIEPAGFARFVKSMSNLQLIICECVIAALAICISLDALLRWSINWSFLFVDEIGGYALVCLAFFGMSIALYEKALFRVDAFYFWLSDINRNRFQLLFDLISLAFMLLLLWQFFGLVTRSFNREISALTILRTPIWIPQLLMLIGALTTSLVLVLHIHHDWKQLMKRSSGNSLNG